jgi:radical SAM superfamily enzyme YgiQ (UPF0313 family)
MKVLFANPPWWAGRAERRWWGSGWLFRRHRAGVRAGSRWPFTYDAFSRPGKRFFYDYTPYPFFMGYAAPYVARETGAQTLFRDSIALRESYDSFYKYLDQQQPNLIFIESATPSWEHDRKVIHEIHRRLPDAQIAVTGPITTTNSEQILTDDPVRACIKGEYEKGAVKVVNGAEGVLEHDLLTREEMNAAPFPYFDDLHAHLYFDLNPRWQKFPHAHVWSSRGCPFKCIFCVWPATMTGNDPDGNTTRTVRHYTPDYMEAFLREIIARHKFRSIYFDDDTFNLGNSHALKMCEVMARIGIPWSAMCRADTSKLETWQLMKDSGCFGVKLGFESGSQYVVDKIVNKHLDLEYAKDVVREIRRVGMSVHGTFTYGLPGETKEQMLETKQFIRSLPFNSYQESGTAEIEGTPLHTLRLEGKLDKYEGAHIDADYDRETDGNVKFQHLVSKLQSS